MRVRHPVPPDTDSALIVTSWMTGSALLTHRDEAGTLVDTDAVTVVTTLAPFQDGTWEQGSFLLSADRLPHFIAALAQYVEPDRLPALVEALRDLPGAQ